MIKKWITLVILNVVLIFFITGCANKTGKPAIQNSDFVSAQELKQNIENESVSSGSKPSLPLSDEQLRSAIMGLEAFRLFCDHFKIQADPNTLNSIKKPALNYIENYIDPILKQERPLRDDGYTINIITIYYLKAYLYLIFDDIDSTREIITQIKQNLSQKLETKTIYHFDQGKITVKDALHELESLIANRSEASKGLKID